MKSFRHPKAAGVYTMNDIYEIYDNQKGKCIYCPTSLIKYYEKDHIIPVSKGGLNIPENIQLLCKRCNRVKHVHSHAHMAIICKRFKNCKNGNDRLERKSRDADQRHLETGKESFYRNITETVDFFGEEYRRLFMPYCIIRLPDEKWVVCNRRYKPLGICRDVWVDYNEYSFYSNINEEKLKKISAYYLKDDTGQYFFLYNDMCIPTESQKYMIAYERRIAALSRTAWTQSASEL